MSPPSVCDPSSGEESDGVAEERTQECVATEEEGDEDGEDQGEDEEGEEEENEPDLEVEPEEEGPTEQRNQQHPPEADGGEKSKGKKPMQMMKRPAGAGTTGNRGQPKAVPKATPKKKGNGKGNGKNAAKNNPNSATTTPPKKTRPEDLVNSEEWLASTEKKLKGQLLEARCYY